MPKTPVSLTAVMHETSGLLPLKINHARFCVVALLSALCFGQTALTNDSIIKMLKAGLGEDLVISTIQTQPAKYSTTPDDLIMLKAGGVSDKVIGAMLAKASGSQTSSAPVVSPGTPTGSSEKLPEPEFQRTIYWFDHGNNKLIALEHAQIDVTGKSKALGFGGAKTTTEVSGERSPVRFPPDSKPEFVLHALQGIDPQSQAAIFRLTVKKGRRELITAQSHAFFIGGVHTAEANKVAVPFQAAKYSDSSIKITPTIPLARGEYGIASGRGGVVGEMWGDVLLRCGLKPDPATENRSNWFLFAFCSLHALSCFAWVAGVRLR